MVDCELDLEDGRLLIFGTSFGNFLGRGGAGLRVVVVRDPGSDWFRNLVSLRSFAVEDEATSSAAEFDSCCGFVIGERVKVFW